MLGSIESQKDQSHNNPVFPNITKISQKCRKKDNFPLSRKHRVFFCRYHYSDTMISIIIAVSSFSFSSLFILQNIIFTLYEGLCIIIILSQLQLFVMVRLLLILAALGQICLYTLIKFCTPRQQWRRLS